MKKNLKHFAVGIATAWLSFNVQAQTTVNYLVVGAGGGGGGQVGGGGGGGQVVNSSGSFGSGVTYAITVGSGGAGGSHNSSPYTNGANGGNSTISGTGVSVTSYGGGGGATGNASLAPTNNGGNGSGGGGCYFPNSSYQNGATAANSNGVYSGGNGVDNLGVSGGGGGGASQVGWNGVNSSGGSGGKGGDGASGTITGLTYGGGGGGGGYVGGSPHNPGGSGGSGGGGNGSDSGNGSPGTTNLGGGGGGGGDNLVGGAGGSGVVVLSFPNGIPYTTTGNPTTTSSGGNTILTYNNSGTFTISNLTPTPWLLGGNINTYNTGASDWYSIGSLDASSDVPFIAGSGVERMRIKSNGHIRMGTANDNDFLTVGGNIVPNADLSNTLGTSSYRWSAVWAQNGTIQTSDVRYKTNVVDLKYGIREIMMLRPVTYSWKEKANGTHLGLIAQELKQVIGEVVVEGNDKNKNLGVAYSELIPVLIKAMQEQQKQIAELKQLVSSGSSGKTGTVINTQNTELSDVVVLNQNQPNPFAEQTIITYSVPQSASSAQMLFYDASGKQVHSVQLIGRGKGQLNVYASDLSNGTYSYTLLIDGKVVDTKKMIKQ